MESNDELKEVDIKNLICYYFDDIIKTEDFHFDNIWIDEKSYEYILRAKSLHIRFDELDGFIRVCDGTRYFVTFDPEKYAAIGLDIL